ncbi:hypothetical protein, partial [Staphylococcus epidermidis]|uniref:hypothetical protein n=1 Tax=Staphylococcus epidermidis TaxID=1282 RepID=UPI0037DA25B8
MHYPILLTDHTQTYQHITTKPYHYFPNQPLPKYLLIQTYFQPLHLKFLTSLPLPPLPLHFLHHNPYNLKQIQDPHFD